MHLDNIAFKLVKSFLVIPFPIFRQRNRIWWEAVIFAPLFRWRLWTRDGKRRPFLREVEHVKDDGFVARIQSVVSRTDHLDDGFPGMHDFLLAVIADDGQFPLLQNTKVDDGMMMPRELASDWKDIAHRDDFRLPLEIVGKRRAIPALRGSRQFQFQDGGGVVILRKRRGLAAGVADGLASGQNDGCQYGRENDDEAFVHGFLACDLM